MGRQDVNAQIMEIVQNFKIREVVTEYYAASIGWCPSLVDVICQRPPGHN